MLITTVCPNCEATLKAPEAVLGKRVKCTKCGKPFVARLPNEGEDEDERPAKTVKTKAVAPLPVKRRSDDEEDAPREKRKKPSRRDDDEEEKVVTRKARPSRDDIDDEDEDEPRPKSRKKGKKKPAGSPVMLFVLIGIGALALIGGAVGIYFGFIKGDSQPTTPTVQGPGGPGGSVIPGGQPVDPAVGWVEINETGGKYKLKFPTKPTPQNLQRETPLGNVTLKVYILGGQSEVFLATHQPILDRAGLTDEQLLDQSVQLAQAGSKGATLASTKTITYQTFPGREFVLTVASQKGSLVLRAILAADRVIVLTAGGDNASATSPRVKAFFESLKIE